MADRYQWDKSKEATNLAKHGIDFDSIAEFDWAGATVVPDERLDYGEVRFRAYGTLHGAWCVVVFTMRGDVYRVISLRRANKRERAKYGPR
jgi:uncharacterized DUF497 family protein